ncbi:MAG TPA: nuclear transport factor 2 family protein [Anaerolineales bacterium]|nr:nuclear transport factor 2 family protein [Anaerolineales bacterium]
MNSKQILENFWQTMKTNDFYAVAELLHDEYILEWPQSGERIRGRENFAKINTYYPAEGKWQFAVNQIISEGDLVVADVTVTDGARTDRVITFSTVRDGKILKQVEFWPEPFEAPTWRAQWVERI